MRLYRQALALLLVAALVTAECAYAAERKPVEQRIDAPRTQMTVKQARKLLVESLSDMVFIKSVREVRFSRHRVSFVGDGIQDGKPYNCFVSFAEMKNLSVKDIHSQRVSLVRSNGKSLRLWHNGYEAYFHNNSDATKFIDGVLILKEAELAPDTEGDDFAAFTASAKTWLVATPKPEMSDEARTFKVLAEDAFERKDFTAALDAFCGALDKYPMWPKGQYNAAVLAAEAEDFELAAHHMRRYLVLAPDAKDAAAAKDKLLLWQHKAKE